MDEEKFKQEYKEFLETIKNYVEQVEQKILQLKIDNRKLRTFLRTEMVSLKSDHLALGRKIDVVEDEPDEPVDSHIF